MNHDNVTRRTDAVKNRWTQNERRQRALASNQRCLDLLLRLSVGNERRGEDWCRAKAST